MLIRDYFVVPNRGILIILDLDSPDLNGVKIGTQLKQGGNVWVVSGLESSRPGRANVIGLLLKPSTPLPERGEISVLRSVE